MSVQLRRVSETDFLIVLFNVKSAQWAFLLLLQPVQQTVLMEYMPTTHYNHILGWFVLVETD
jgi:hypothetical protein